MAIVCVGGYAAFSGSGSDTTRHHGNPGDAVWPSASTSHAAGLPKAPVAGATDSVPPSGAPHLPVWASWTDAPAVPAPLVSGVRAVRMSGTAYVFGTDASGAIRYVTRTGGSFGSWGKLTGIHVSGEPAPVVLPGGVLRLFATGTDGLIYQRDYSGGTWTPWSQLDGHTRVDSPPAAAATGDRVDLVARIGSDLATTSYVGGAWTAWAAVSTVGRVAGDPALAAENGGRVDAFVAAAAGTVQHTQLADGLWHTYRSVVGLTEQTRPEAVQLGSGEVYVFSPGPDYAASASGASWIQGTLPSGSASSYAPGAYTDGGGITLFRVTPSGGLQYTHGK
jgi:serine/threonine-protein kinase